MPLMMQIAQLSSEKARWQGGMMFQCVALVLYVNRSVCRDEKTGLFDDRKSITKYSIDMYQCDCHICIAAARFK